MGPVTDDPPEYAFKERDLAILRELARDPQLSSRDLAEILEEEYGIDVSHVTVSESIRTMRSAGVFRETIIPNETYYTFSMFEFKFNPEHFAESWRPAFEAIRNDKHTLFYFLSDGEYPWKSIMMFPSQDAESRWIHEFYKHHGDVIENVRISMMTKVFKFGTDPAVFDVIQEHGGE